MSPAATAPAPPARPPARVARPARPVLPRAYRVAGTGPVAAAESWMRRAALLRLPVAAWDAGRPDPARASRALPRVRPVHVHDGLCALSCPELDGVDLDGPGFDWPDLDLDGLVWDARTPWSAR